MKKEMHLFYASVLLFLFTATALNAQLTIKATGTGKTTGEIANLEISNESALAQRFAMPEYFYIPSANGLQGYIVVNDALSDLIIQPGERLRLPLDNGYCTNIHRPPVPNGQDLPPFNTWITPGIAAPLPHPGDELLSGPGWVPAGEVLQGQVPTFPGTEIALPGRIDPDEEPSGAAPVLFEALQRISLTVDDLYATGEVPPTPFSGQPAKERETLIQQTFWIYSSLLNPSDEDYTVNDFAAQTWRQYKEVVGDTTNIAPEVRREVESGIQNFWNSFEAVGEKAKVLKELTDVRSETSLQECSCTFSALSGIVITRNGEQVEPGTTLQPGNYVFTARFLHDCPKGCETVIQGSWVADFIPADGGAILQDFGQGGRFSFDAPSEGALSVRFRGSVLCNGRPCPAPVATTPEAIVTLPAERCPCERCELVQPLRIVNARTGAEITGDSIPSYVDRLRVEPPVVSSDCPEGCNSTTYVSVEKSIRYRHGGTYLSNNSAPHEFGVGGPGEISLTSRYRCYCDGNPCGYGETTRTLQVVESNDCCDRIRNRTGGPLRFGFGNGTVTIDRNQLTIHVPPSPPETFRLSFNLEAVFCNLNDDQIYAVLERISSQRVSDQGVEESISVSDVSLGGPVNSPEDRPFYSLLFSKKVNGREVMVSIILDEEACVFDIQVLYNGNIYEHAAPPYFTPSQLENMALNMGVGTDPRFWYRAMGVLSQLYRAREYGRQQQYSRAMEAFLNLMHVGTNRLLQEPLQAEQRAALNELRMLIVRAKTRSGFSHLDELLNKMIEVVNRL